MNCALKTGMEGVGNMSMTGTLLVLFIEFPFYNKR
jgi:hypothetical protein